MTPTSVSVLSASCHARVDLLGSATEQNEVSGVTLRAQDVRAGDLFAALEGVHTHGAQFAADAIAAGATAILTDPRGRAIIDRLGHDGSCAVLVHPNPRSVLGSLSARIYGQPSRRLKLIGITGTSGKTTTSYMTEAALMADHRTVGLLGTVETRVDGVREPSSLTTPEAPALQGILAHMLERGVDSVVMEVSSHALAQGRVQGSVFAVGGFTNLSRDHLDYHHTMEEYFDAKALLFAPESPVHTLHPVICVDDDWGKRMAAIAGRDAVTVSTGPTPAQWRAGPSQAASDGSQRVEIIDPDGRHHEMTVSLPGRYNVANALLAVAIAHTAGVSTATAVAAIASVSVPGRLEKIDRGQPFLAVVDYAHKPAAVSAVLTTLRAQADARVAVVLGAGGDRDTEKRPLMGAAAARGAELVIVTDDNPRSEDPAAIRAAVRAGAQAVPADERPAEAEEIREVADRAAAIEAAVRWARSGDIVLIAGKGHERGQEIDGVKHPFDDREVLAEALGRLSASTARTDGVEDAEGAANADVSDEV